MVYLETVLLIYMCVFHVYPFQKSSSLQIQKNRVFGISDDAGDDGDGD